MISREERMRYNAGVQNTGSGSVSVTGSAVGTGARVYFGRETAGADAGAAGCERGADIGIITTLSEETQAMAKVLAAAGELRERAHDGGFRCTEADIEIGHRRLRTVLTQADSPGQRPTVIAFERLRRTYAPEIIALVGIAGGIHPALRLGDVVVAHEVIYYDLRKEKNGETLRRGQARPIPGTMRRAVNHFFSREGEPWKTHIGHPDGSVRECSVLPGPIGSGEAVVADRNSRIRQYVSDFNDKVLCLETEAGGLAEAFHQMAGGPDVSGWLVVRGISDLADADKADTYHNIASRHAAVVLLRILPDLFPQF
jgi:adenosylhomocysteine nucleosidase